MLSLEDSFRAAEESSEATMWEGSSKQKFKVELFQG